MDLGFVTAPSGARFTVSNQHAARFGGLLKDLEAAGYAVQGNQSGGYNPRNIAGTNTPSRHAHGAAIDVNWTDNPRGGMGKIPADLARTLAAKHGLVWGGDWKNPDPMHFEVPGQPGHTYSDGHNHGAPTQGMQQPTAAQGTVPMPNSQQTGPNQSFLQQLLNPTVMAGLAGMESAWRGGSASEGMQTGLKTGLAQQAAQRQQAQQAAISNMLQNPQALGNLPPALVEIARITGDLGPLAPFMKPAELTSDERNYRRAQADPAFRDHLLDMKRAGATAITTDMRGENAEAKMRGEGLGKRLNTIAEDGIEAQKDGVLFSRMAELSQNVDPGTRAAALEQIRSLTGIALDPNAGNVQAFKGLANYLAPRMRVPGSGASSDRDVNMFFNALPSLLGTPDGNRIVNETFQGIIASRRAAAEIAQQWQRGEITAAQADKAMASIPDPFAQFRKVAPPQAGKPQAPQPPKPGAVYKGHRFKGGDPARPENWEPVR